MKHNYNNLMLPYYKDRVDALIGYVQKLEFELEYKEKQVEFYKKECYGKNSK